MGFKEIEALLEATFKIMDSGKSRESNKNIDINIEIQFLHMFINTMVGRCLGAGETFEASRAQYARMKMGIQEAVALGFQLPMEQFSNQKAEFYCLIKCLPEGSSNATSH